MSDHEHTPRLFIRSPGDDEFKPLGRGLVNFDTPNLTVDETDSETEPASFVTDWNSKPVTVEFEFTKPDPEVLDLLGFTDQRPEATHSLEVHGYRKRKWWQWLLRRPRQRYHVYLPNVRIEKVSGNE